MKSLYSELGKMTVHCTALPHPSLSQSQWDNASTYLFPFVSMGTWGNKDTSFSLSPPSSFPLTPSILSSFPFFLGTNNTKVLFFFSEACFSIYLHYEKIQTIKLGGKKNSIASERLIVQQLKPKRWASRILFSPLPLFFPPFHIHWMPLSEAEWILFLY